MIYLLIDLLIYLVIWIAGIMPCMRRMAAVLALCLVAAAGSAQTPALVVLQPDRVFDGERIQAGWVVIVRGDRIDAVGPAASTLASGRHVRSEIARTYLL